MTKRLFTLALLMVVVLLTVAACGGDDNGDSGGETQTQATVAPTKESNGDVLGTPVPVANQDPAGSGEYAFEPSEFVFTTGDIVAFQLTAETELHNFSVDGLSIDIDIDGTSGPGAKETVVFTFENPGTYRLFCLYHEAQGMVGTITVR